MNQLNSAQVQHRKSKDESYLSSTQISYLKSKLLIWRQSLLNQMNQTKVFLQSDNHNHGDLLDRQVRRKSSF
ncbi:hypothetical protein EAW55_13945 [Legionella jordanis]|nr:hypothetical protein EAW55_13945 [Legionella jordanis]